MPLHSRVVMPTISRHTRPLAAGVGAILSASLCLQACGGSPVGPTDTSPQISVAAPPIGAPAPAPAPGTFTIRLPIDEGDAARAAFGLNPFGVHGADHALDGHPGWDFEYRGGASVRAAANGTVLSVMPDGFTPGLTTIQIQHQVAAAGYRTIYTNIASVAPGIAVGTSVVAGQPIGSPAGRSQMIGRTPVTFFMTHFQVDDFASNDGLTNTSAVSPDTRLDPSARAAFEAIWQGAAFVQELVEPFPNNARNAAFPMTRTWSLQSGDLPTRIEFRRTTPNSNDYEYTLASSPALPMETGTATIDPLARPLTTIDLRPSAAAPRLGVYDIVGDTMRLALGDAGGPRPASLAGGSTYMTTR